MDINETTKKTCGILAIIAFFILFAWASNEEYKEVVISSMSNAAYEHIHEELGDGCTTQEIVDRYKSNKIFYDSLQ